MQPWRLAHDRSHTAATWFPLSSPVDSVCRLVGRDHGFVLVANIQKFLLCHDAVTPLLHVVFENPRLDNHIHGTWLFAETAVGTLVQFDVVARRASRTLLGHFRLDGNSQGGAGGFSCGGAVLRTGAFGKYYRWRLWVVSECLQLRQVRTFKCRFPGTPSGRLWPIIDGREASFRPFERPLRVRLLTLSVRSDADHYV